MSVFDPNVADSLASAINREVQRDFNLDADFQRARDIAEPVDALSVHVVQSARRRPTVYTAFDGDHFFLVPEMRRYAVRQGVVPANPESVLGYKDTVEANQTKRGVLIDDLSVLGGCDELWVFTDLAPAADSLQSLAEGVVVEILFFLKRRPDGRVAFVPVRALFDLADPTPPAGLELTYTEAKAALHPDQANGVLSLANSGNQTDRQLKDVEVFVFDLLDAKYAAWLRASSYTGRKTVPLVPQLALSLCDFYDSAYPLYDLLVGWTSLTLNLARVGRIYPPFAGSQRGFAATHLERAWLGAKGKGRAALQIADWADLPIPKARQQERWPLTKREGGIE